MSQSESAALRPRSDKPGADGAATADAELARRFEAALRLSGVTLAEQDGALRYTWSANAPSGVIDGRSDDEILPAELADPIRAAKQDVIASGEPRRLVLQVADGDRDEWYELAIEPRRDGDGKVVGITTATIDITEQKRAEEHLRLLLLELAHRSKNLLAVIQGIANRTAQDSGSIGEFSRRFSGRLHALARAHDLLTESDWHGADFEQLVRGQISVVAGHVSDRVIMTGDQLYLRPGAAQHVSLAFHELASNAVSHGALSRSGGRVTIGWHRTVPNEDGIGAVVTWREEGGPPVTEPDKRPFGRVLLEEIVPAAVGGRARLVFAPSGIDYTLEIGLPELG